MAGKRRRIFAYIAFAGERDGSRGDGPRVSVDGNGTLVRPTDRSSLSRLVVASLLLSSHRLSSPSTIMSWLKPSSSNNSIHDASASRSKPSTGTSSSSTVGTNGNKHSQPPVTRFLACGTVYLTHTLSVPSSVISPPSDPTQDSNSTTAATAATTNTVRAKQVTTHRGGTAVNVLSLLAQFNAFATRPHNSHHNGSSSPSPSTTPNPFRKGAIECALVSPFGSDPAGRALLHELELEGVRTRFCKLHPAGVPTAFVLQSGRWPKVK